VRLATLGFGFVANGFGPEKGERHKIVSAVGFEAQNRPAAPLGIIGGGWLRRDCHVDRLCSQLTNAAKDTRARANSVLVDFMAARKNNPKAPDS
jgi:hypothetical protein